MAREFRGWLVLDSQTSVNGNLSCEDDENLISVSRLEDFSRVGQPSEVDRHLGIEFALPHECRRGNLTGVRVVLVMDDAPIQLFFAVDRCHAEGVALGVEHVINALENGIQ